jgi:hypothetical protein
MIRSIAMVSALLLTGAAVDHSALAQAGAKDPLQEICSGFLAQGGGSVTGDHAKLCSCLVGETQKQLTRQEMEAYNKAATTGQPPPPAIMEKVIGVATLCLTQSR